MQYSRNHGLYIVENREIHTNNGAASQIRTGYRVPWGMAPWEPSDLAIEKADEVASYAEINKNPLR